RVRDELRAWRREVMVGGSVDGVLETVRRNRRTIAELEALPDEEGVLLATVRDGEVRSNLGDELAARRARLVRIVVELRCGRVLEPPRSGDVGELRVDLDRSPGRPDLPDATLLERRGVTRCTRKARCDQKACAGHEHRNREPKPSAHVSPFRELEPGLPRLGTGLSPSKALRRS